MRGFYKYFLGWVRAACAEWGYAEPQDEFYTKFFNRLPAGLLSLLTIGIKQGLVIPRGRMFTLKGLMPHKGPYSWFSRSSAKKPAPNWEYFVHVAEFVRLSRVAAAHGLHVAFEDDLMDLALYQKNHLVVCCEVKERAGQIHELVRGIGTYQEALDFAAPDRGNDSLRKAKYIIRRQPEYLSLVAIGVRLEYRVVYPAPQTFELIRDVIPWA